MTPSERLEKDYAGICACCFAPIKAGEETQFRENGRRFHRNCAKKADNYYVNLEKRLAARKIKRLKAID